jgi:lipopolysaccharide transport system permease protein
MVVLTAFFGNPARLPSEGVPYPLFAYTGLLSWTFFSNAILSSSNSLVGNAPLITKVYFPRVLIPAVAVGARVVDFAISFVLLVGMMAYYGAGFTWRSLAVVPLVLITMLLALACGMFLSALNARYRDVNFALPHFLQFLMFATPVFYSTTMLPHRLQVLMNVNPLAALINGYRAALLGSAFHWRPLAGCVVMTLMLLVVATWMFRTTEQHVADVL